MLIKWHKILLACIKCDREPTILQVSCAADGEVMMDLVCAHCGINLTWRSTTAKMIANSVIADVIEARDEKKAERKALCPPVGDHKKDDEDFLHSMGVSS